MKGKWRKILSWKVQTPPTFEEEGGITEISLRNAEKLFDWYGLPHKIELYQLQQEQLVEATWDDGYIFEFSGFSWGYGGGGPRGLEKFFQMLNIYIPIGIDTIASWPEENFPALTFIKGEDYGERKESNLRFSWKVQEPGEFFPGDRVEYIGSPEVWARGQIPIASGHKGTVIDNVPQDTFSFIVVAVVWDGYPTPFEIYNPSDKPNGWYVLIENIKLVDE